MNNQPTQISIAIIAAEPSGDLLGGGLMQALKEQQPGIQFVGVGGPKMLEQGMECLEPMQSLSVMGLVEVLNHLPRLLKLRSRLLQYWQDNPPDLFIGIDAPDFNLPVEQRLKANGIPTVHYVSPTVWAWRPKRVEKIRKAADLVLSIFPFERDFLQQHQINSTYVGHTLAANMPMQPDQAAARQRLNIPAESRVLAILPGSRRSEVKRLARPFLQTAQACLTQQPDLHCIVPLINENIAELWRSEKQQHASQLVVQEIMADSRSAMAAADVLLSASGTATFEGLLSKRPMVIGYKLHPFSYWLAYILNLVKVEHAGMANLLTDERLAPEFIQADCEAAKLTPAVLEFFTNQALVDTITDKYQAIHQTMLMPTDNLAAQAIIELMQKRQIRQTDQTP